MDEPLSNLDAKLRVSTRAQIKNLHHELKTTTIYVTHDQIEAMTLADRVVVMNKGEVQQVGTPIDIYDKPANTFVAGFIGSPAMNLMEGTMKGGVFEGKNVRIPGFDGVRDGAVTVGFRAEDATLAAIGEIAAPVYSMELLGDSSMATVQAGATLVAVKAAKDFSAEIGARHRRIGPVFDLPSLRPGLGVAHREAHSVTPEDHSARSRETLDVIHRMEAALGAGSNDMATHFHEDFLWRGNAGCGTKRGLDEFRANWQLPFARRVHRPDLPDRKLPCGRRLGGLLWPYRGDAFRPLHGDCADRQASDASPTWISGASKTVGSPTTRSSVDFAAVLAQLGRDVFDGEGWEAYDRGEKTAARTPNEEHEMTITYLKRGKPEAERADDDAKVRATVETTLAGHRSAGRRRGARTVARSSTAMRPIVSA